MVMKDAKLVQLPGPKNSLGLVKFDMDDPQQIYMHDTPFKELFALPERHRSHGCIRVEDALGFAAMLTSEDGVDSQFEEALASGDEKWIKLKTEIPVRLLYHTAYWDGSRVQFRADVYGWDEDVGRALGLIIGPRRRPIEQGQDIGP
jgi:murein L,D-transpeptidase YcbB/YkuD